MHRQIHDELVSVAVLDDLDLTLCPVEGGLTGPLVTLQHAKEARELRDKLSCVLTPYLGVALDPTVQVGLWVHAHWVLYADARQLLMEVWLYNIDAHTVRVVVITELYLRSMLELTE